MADWLAFTLFGLYVIVSFIYSSTKFKDDPDTWDFVIIDVFLGVFWPLSLLFDYLFPHLTK